MSPRKLQIPVYVAPEAAEKNRVRHLIREAWHHADKNPDNKDAQEAIHSALERAIWQYPENPYYHYKLGIYFKKQGRLSSALSHFNEAKLLEPGNDRYKNAFDRCKKKAVKLREPTPPIH